MVGVKLIIRWVGHTCETWPDLDVQETRTMTSSNYSIYLYYILPEGVSYKKDFSYPFLSLIPQPSDDDTMSLHSQVSETARADPHILLTKLDSNKGVLSALVVLAKG